MSRLWHLCFAIMIMAINCVCVTAEPTELESLRKRLDMVDLRLASDMLVLRREMDTERRLRIELQSTVHELQEQLQQQQQKAINHTRSLQETDLQQQKFGNNFAKSSKETDILEADVQKVNYENQIRHNVVVLHKAFREEKLKRKQMESTVQDLQSKHLDLQLDLRTATDQVKELMHNKSSTEKSLTSLRSELHHLERKQNELNSSASTARLQMDAYIDGVSNQVCQLNPSYVDVCQNYGVNKSSCCLRRALESVLEIKVNGQKLSAFEKQINLRVSFSARIASSVQDINPWDTIIFRSVIHNDGSAYNLTNGKFVAPVDGTYVFFSHILGASRELETALKINEKLQLWLYSGDPRNLASASNLLIIHLNKGDSARMVKHGSAGHRPFYIHGTWSTFSGFLLSAG